MKVIIICQGHCDSMQGGYEWLSMRMFSLVSTFKLATWLFDK